MTAGSGCIIMLLQALREVAEGFCGVGASVSGPITLAGFKVLGTDKLLRAMIKSPDKVHEFLRYITRNVKIRIDEFAVIDVGFSMADPIASTTMLSSRMYREFAFPYTLEISSYINKSGKCYLPCLRQYEKIWEDIAKLDIGLSSVDNEMDIEETCEFFGVKGCCRKCQSCTHYMQRPWI